MSHLHKALSLLVVITAVTFSAGVEGDFVWDDRALVVENPLLQGGMGEALSNPFLANQSGQSAYWRPVVSAAFWVQNRLFGSEAAGYHIISILLHLACVFLTFGWLRRRGYESWWPALCGAALFALHPSRPESVAWVSGATDLWMAFFTLLALRTWDLYRCSWSALATGLLLALALWSKETAVVIPALLWIDSRWRPPTDRRKPGLDVGIVFAIMLAAVGLRFFMAPLASGAEFPEILPWMSQVTAALGHYLGCLLWPWQASTQVGMRTLGPDGIETFSSLAIAAGSVGCAGTIWLATKALKHPRLRPLAADVAWLVLPLLPVLHILPLGTRWLVAYRYLYLPMLGAACLLARALALRPEPPSNRIPALAAALILAAFGVASAQHTQHFASEKDLWEYELSLNPQALIALERLGSVHANRGDTPKALDLWDKGAHESVALRDTEMAAVFRLLLARNGSTEVPAWDLQTLQSWNQFYQTLADEGLATAPAPHNTLTIDLRGPYEETLKSHPGRFMLPRAIAALRAGDLASAEAQFRKITQSPNASLLAWRERIRTHGLRFKWKTAFSALKHAMAKFGHKPELVTLQASLRKGRFTQAKPGPKGVPPKVSTLLRDAHILSMLGGGHLLKGQIRMLLPSLPHVREVWITLAQLDLSLGNFKGAEEILTRAVKENPDNADFWREQIRQIQQNMPTAKGNTRD